MKIDAKPFKTLEEQLKILNEWGNNFLDKKPEDRGFVYDYIKKYNFQVCVDGFAPLLWKNLIDGIKEQNLKFIDNFQFKDLKELFNFDKTLKNITNDLLQETEKRLTSGIIYHTLKSLYSICKNAINLPFLLFDDYWSQIIGRSLFSNNLSRQSFCNEENKFKYDEYYSFVAQYIEPFNTWNMFSKNADLRKFYFYKILKNRSELKLKNNLGKYKTKNKNSNKFICLKIEDLNSQTVSCTFNEFFQWCKAIHYVPEKFKNDDVYIENSTIDGMVNWLAKAFIPIYKSFTQEPFGDLIKFFSRLNENIQVKIIKEYFPTFYQKILALIKSKQDKILILISTFISFSTLFKNLRNRIAHLDIIYNFWYIYAPNFSNKTRSISIQGTEFWIGNKQTCAFINKLIDFKNNYFFSNYFKDIFFNKDSNYYLQRIISLKIKVYSKENNGVISFTNNSDDSNAWPLPIFFLKDAIQWLLIFTDDACSFEDIFQQCLLKSNVSNNEIKNRLHDYLFNKIIISLQKIADKE